MVFVIGLFTNNLFAQGAYIHINTGYGFNMSSQNLSSFDFINTTKGSNSTTYEQINVSLGKGIYLGGAFGYMLNENIGAELGISYLLGGKSKANYSDLYRTEDYTLSSKMLRFNPSLLIAYSFENIKPYAKFGFIIGFGSIMYECNGNYVFNSNRSTYEEKLKLNGGIALGLSSGIGAMYELSDNMSFFGELNMVSLSYAPTKREFTEYIRNGVNQLPNMTTSDKVVEYVDSYTYNSNNPPADTQPRQELKEKLPYGSFGLNVGLRINL